jgi:hypothetical protein
MAWPVPALDVNADLLPFAVIAVAMVVVTVVVLGLVRPRDGRPVLLTQMLLAIATVGGGSVLLLALLFVFLDPNGTTAWTWVLLGFNFMMTVPVGLWFVGQILYEDRRVPAGGWLWPAGLGLAVTGSEMLMGLLFVVGGVSGAIGAFGAFALGLSSIWFFWSMAGVMAPLVLWAPLSPAGRAGGWALVLAASVAPWVRPYPLVGGVAMAVLMGAAFLAVLRLLVAERVAPADATLLVGLGGAFLAMSATGLAVAATSAAGAAVLGFGSTMAVVMISEVTYLVRRAYASGTPSASASVPAGTSDRTEAPAPRAGPTLGP